MILKHLLYCSIIFILGIFIIQHIRTNWPVFSIIEGARTYPMPRRHPITYTTGAYNNESTNHIISMNTIIDQIVDTYFDEHNIPYINTIDGVINYIVGPNPYQYGTVSDEMKSKLTDIGYYFLEIVIPMLPTITNPKPVLKFPPLKWSGLPSFNVETANIPTYLIYKGPNSDKYNSIINNVDTTTTTTTSTNNSSETSGDGSSSPTQDACDNDSNNSCGIQCPETCMLMALNGSSPAPAPAPAPVAGSITNENDKSTYNYGKSNGQSMNYTDSYSSKNTATIGSSIYTGYDITQIKVDSKSLNSPILTDKINKTIYAYFTKDGTKAGEPTKEFMELFEYYYQQFSPMDMYHQEKLRNLVFYVLQTIIPGIPTPSIPHLYVQWKPFGKYSINP
jgi:hypothetical protein